MISGIDIVGDNLNEDEKTKYEERIRTLYTTMNLNEDDFVQAVDLTYNEVAPENQTLVDYEYEDEGTLSLVIHDISVEKGIKNVLAKLAYEIRANYIFADFRRGWAPAIIPLVSLVIPLFLYDMYTWNRGNLLLSLLLLPTLYALIALPFILFCTKKKMQDNALIRQRMHDYLERASIYSEEETSAYTLKYTKFIPLDHVFDYMLFIPMLMIFIWLVFYLN